LPDGLRNPNGGMGVQCKNIIAHLHDIHFDIVCNKAGEDFSGDNYESRSMNFLRPPVAHLDPWSENILTQTSLLSKAMGFPRPDLVHAFDWSSFTAGMYAAKYHEVPLVITMQLSITQLINDRIVPAEGPLTEITLALELQGMLKADLIIQVSEYYAKSWPSFSKKSVIIPNGVNVDEWKPSKKLNLGDNFNVVYIGRIDPMKGITSIMKEGVPEGCRLHVISSSGGNASRLRDEVIKWATREPRVSFVGPKYGQEKIDYLCAADAVLMPSMHEPFGIVGLEAMASRSILISSLVGGIREYADESVALAVNPREEGSIYRGIERARDLREDERRRRLDIGISRARSLDWKRISPALRQAYNLALGR